MFYHNYLHNESSAESCHLREYYRSVSSTYFSFSHYCCCVPFAFYLQNIKNEILASLVSNDDTFI